MRNLTVEEMKEVSGGTFFGVFRLFRSIRSFWGHKSGYGHGGSKGGSDNGGGKGGDVDNGGGKGGNGGGKYGC